MHSAYYDHTASQDADFSTDMNTAVLRASELLNKKVAYSSSHWAECLASLHYLQANIFSSSASPDEIVEELIRRKPHLDNKQLDMEALNLVSKLCA